MANETDAKLDKLLAGLGTLADTVKGLVVRMDSVEAEVKKDSTEEPPKPADEHGAKLDKIMDHLQGLHGKHDALKSTCDALHVKHDALSEKHEALAKKVDSIEEAGKKALAETAEPAPAAVDSTKKDSEQMGTKETGSAETALATERHENGLSRNDSAEHEKKLDAANERIVGLEKVIADMQKRLPAEIPSEQRDKFTAAQSKWERIAQAFGDAEGAPRAMNGESLSDYQRRLMGKYKHHSNAWKEKDLMVVPDAVLDIAIEQIHADALAAALAP